ncbi:MAG: hypothetical protein ACJ8F7_15115 [Gemmataceae bacterium]
MAVLGARRPGVGAWNAVVAGLVAVQLIPLVQDFLSGTSWLNDPIWKLFLAATIAVGLLNYFPTRLGIGAALLLAGCGMQLAVLNQPNWEMRWAAILAAGISPWVAAVAVWLRRRPAVPGDELWFRFRERFGFLWAQRLREQFNAAAGHAGLGVEFGWMGLRRSDGAPPTDADQTASTELLSALIQRFGLP